MTSSTKYGLFSEKNITQTWKEEINKGKPMLKLFPDLNEISIKLSKERKENRKKISEYPQGSEIRKIKIKTYKRLKKRHQRFLRELVNHKIKDVSQEIREMTKSEHFTWRLNFSIHDGKSIVGSEHPDYIYKIVDLCLKNHLDRAYPQKLENKEHVIPQIQQIINSHIPFDLVKFDISRFYESVDSQRILKQLEIDHNLDPIAKKLIQKLIEEFYLLTSTEKGLPRGISTSSSLAEIYLSLLDEKIREKLDPDHMFRFVDDYLLIKYCNDTNLENFFNDINDVVNSLGLSLNSEKTVSARNQHGLPDYWFNYLGYKFKVNQQNKIHSALRPGTLITDISDNKYVRYRRRIDKSFQIYTRELSKNQDYANKNLFLRLRFLTSNSNLFSYKRKKVFGAHFNNKYITNYKSSRLRILDQYLKSAIFNSEKDNSINIPDYIKNLSFKRGFINITFYKSSPKQINQIKRVWKEIA